MAPESTPMKNFLKALASLISPQASGSSVSEEKERLLDYMIPALTESNSLVDARVSTEAQVGKAEPDHSPEGEVKSLRKRVKLYQEERAKVLESKRKMSEIPVPAPCKKAHHDLLAYFSLHEQFLDEGIAVFQIAADSGDMDMTKFTAHLKTLSEASALSAALKVEHDKICQQYKLR